MTGRCDLNAAPKRWFRPSKIICQRRCPSDMPSASARWRRAPIVRFIALEIFTTGVLLFECAFSSRSLAFVHATRVGRFAFFAI
jgi:hypothetical protein